MTNRIRYMRLILFFDLPMETLPQRREYARFRKWLIKNGYLMMQKSVYSKLAIDSKLIGTFIANLEANKPKEGLVQVLQVTEKQYAGIRYIVGSDTGQDVLSSTEGLIVI